MKSLKSKVGAGEDMETRSHHVLAATLTLSQPGGADFTHAILMSVHHSLYLNIQIVF